MIAVVPVRDGMLARGGTEAICEAQGNALLAGDGACTAAASLACNVERLRAWETPGFAPAAWSRALAPLLAADDVVILPASPDGRDLAPRLAHAMQRPCLGPAMEVTPQHVVVLRHGGLALARVDCAQPLVVTLQPGVRGIDEPTGCARPPVEVLDIAVPAGAHDAQALDDTPGPGATPALDLADASRVLAGGAGLGDDAATYAVLLRVATALDAAAGATRMVTDAGLLPDERQVGTTGAAIAPSLYVALGVSGAVQHVAGIGRPDHIVSVNLDPNCPMSAMADLAVVCDAAALLLELATLLGVRHG